MIVLIPSQVHNTSLNFTHAGITDIHAMDSGGLYIYICITSGLDWTTGLASLLETPIYIETQDCAQQPL